MVSLLSMVNAMTSGPTDGQASTRCAAESVPDWLHPDLAWTAPFWQRGRHGRPLPARAFTDPRAMPPAMLPMVFVVERRTDDWWIRLAGSSYRDLYDREITGMRVADLAAHSEGGQRLGEDYQLAIEQRLIVFTAATMTWRRTARPVRYHRALLPFCADGDTTGDAVAYLMGAATLLD